MALRKNLPRNWILKDIQLKKIARYNDPQQWISTELLSEKQVSSYGQNFAQIHERHQSLSAKPISVSQAEKIDFEKLFGLIKSRLQRCATRAEVPVELICNQRTLKQKVHQMIHTKKYEPFEQWRGEILNESLEQVFNQFYS
jgi:ribonuclease D